MILTGDCLDILPTLDAESVQCCCTSPPYWGLRDYGVDGQIGLESTPEEYVEKLVAVFREVRRVLRDDGVLWLNLGDTYATGAGKACSPGGGSQGENFSGPRGYRGGHDKSPKASAENPQFQPNRMPIDGLKPKDLVGIPWRVAFALQADGWYLRQDIIWAKPNPMPESVTDRCTKAHEYIFLLTKNARYFYDAEAVKEGSAQEVVRNGRILGRGKQAYNIHQLGSPSRDNSGGFGNADNMRNRRSVWTITTKPFKEAHFATFPQEIPEICIKAGSRPGDTILDPFGGANTTGQVAERLGRKSIIIELNPAYVEMGEQREDAVRLPLFQEVL